jgi:NADH-quinone oxidoreductase subunit J
MTPVFFLLFALMAVVGATMVVVQRNPVVSALYLVLVFMSLGGFFVLLAAPFIAAVQVVVYAGAIMVVFLFVIMLLNLQEDAPPPRRPTWSAFTLVGASLLALGVLYFLHQAGPLLPGPGVAGAAPVGFGSIESVGLRLFTQYLLQFEITGLLMLAGVVGAVVLAKRRIG